MIPERELFESKALVLAKPQGLASLVYDLIADSVYSVCSKAVIPFQNSYAALTESLQSKLYTIFLKKNRSLLLNRYYRSRIHPTKQSS